MTTATHLGASGHVLVLTLDRDNAVRWVIAAAIAIATLLVLEVLKWLAGRYARSAPQGRLTRTLPASLLGSMNNVALVVLAIYAGTRVAHVPASAESAIGAVAVIAIALQAMVWGRHLIQLTARLYEERTRSDPENALAPGTLYALRFISNLVLGAAILLLALDNLGVQITTLVAGLGIGGIAVALAAQSILGDLFASLAIVLDRPFVVGDFIVVTSDLLGTVERIGLKTTRIRSLSGEQLIFANHDLVNSRVRNFKRMTERRVVFRVGLVYATTAEEMQNAVAIVREAITTQQDAGQARVDRVHFVSFGDSSLNIEAVYYVLSPDYNVYMDVHQAINLAIMRGFGAQGLDIAFPTRTLYLHHEVTAGDPLAPPAVTPPAPPAQP